MPHLLSRLIPGSLVFILIASVIPWAVSVLRTPLHSDLVWLYEAFARLVAGQTLAESIFEPNPPLSLFTYAVPYAMTAVTGLPPHITIFIFIMVLLAAAALVVRYAVAKITGPDAVAPFLAMAAFVVSQTIMTSALFGERDHLIGIVLAPFVLMQYALTLQKPVPVKLQWAVFLTGAFFILLKPHHGLIPFFMIVHRMMRQKSCHFLRDADFLSLAFAVLAYGALLLLFFGDYRTVIFPDVVRLYLTTQNPDILKNTSLLMIPGFVVLGLAWVLRNKIPRARLIMFLSVGAMASLVPYAVQGKGFFYHLFPAFGFFLPAAVLLLGGVLEREIRKAQGVMIISVAVLLALSYVLFPANMKPPSYQAYQEMPLTKIVMDNCAGIRNCSFMMFNDSMGITHETAYVTGLTHGSRFPSFWFLPEMLEMEKTNPGSASAWREAYGRRVAEDLERYKPRTLIIGRFREEGEPFFDFAAWWAMSDEFRDAWQVYEHAGTIDIDYGDYYPGTFADKGGPSVYDIYRRKSSAAGQ